MKKIKKIFVNPTFLAAVVLFCGVSIAAYSFSGPPAGCNPGSCNSPLEVNYSDQTVSVNSTPTNNQHVANKEYVDTVVSAASSSTDDLFCVPFGGNSLSSSSCPSVPGYSLYTKNAACCWKKIDTSSTKIIFVTSIGYTGNLGGETGADAKCQARANVANLDGTFKAWLLDGNTDQYIYNKFADTSYSNILGQKVITTFLDYNSNYTGFQSLEAQINYDEFGRQFTSDAEAWTNLSSNGERLYSGSTGSNCYSFTSNGGSAYYSRTQETDYKWYSYTSISCANKRRLICVEI